MKAPIACLTQVIMGKLWEYWIFFWVPILYSSGWSNDLGVSKTPWRVIHWGGGAYFSWSDSTRETTQFARCEHSCAKISLPLLNTALPESHSETINSHFTGDASEMGQKERTALTCVDRQVLDFKASSPLIGQNLPLDAHNCLFADSGTQVCALSSSPQSAVAM